MRCGFARGWAGRPRKKGRSKRRPAPEDATRLGLRVPSSVIERRPRKHANHHGQREALANQASFGERTTRRAIVYATDADRPPSLLAWPRPLLSVAIRSRSCLRSERGLPNLCRAYSSTSRFEVRFCLRRQMGSSRGAIGRRAVSASALLRPLACFNAVPPIH